MTNNHSYKHLSISVFIFVMVLGLALALPWIASSEGLAAYSEITTQSNAPEATRYYVAKTGDESSGLDWPHAFTDLQDALGAVKSGDEIWVAAGVYTPGATPSDSYNLVPGVAVYGGFDVGDNQFSERDWESNITLLSGDIDGDDTTDENNVVTSWTNIIGDNSYHVVTADGTTGKPISSNTVLDGFTITAGQADDTIEPNPWGGGFYCDGSYGGSKCNPTLKNLIFSGNFARYGGGLFNNGSVLGESSPYMFKCTFTGNSAERLGGGMVNSGEVGGVSNPQLIEVSFYNNSALIGGAMYNFGNESGTGNPYLKNVTFSGNMAEENGGAMYNGGSQGESNPTIVNTIFSGNWALGNGGAIYNNGEGDDDYGTSSPSLSNVIFSGNIAKYGGAMFNDGTRSGESSPKLTNVTFSGNSAIEYGGAMSNSGRLGNSHPDVRNTILWNNKDKSGIGTISANILNSSAKTTLSYSLVESSGGSGSGWIGGDYVDGGGNIDENPMFVKPIDPSTAPKTAGNLRLKIDSPAIDLGNNPYILGFTTDLDGEPRIVDGDLDGTPAVDMGAYEFQIEELYMPLIFR